MKFGHFPNLQGFVSITRFGHCVLAFEFTKKKSVKENTSLLVFKDFYIAF
jgi:hypothetical protein